ncbi:MAG: tryptophan--tRNA ligase [Coriobacteriia bacterium]
MTKKRALTGYRPTGKLHLGHWFGNLQNMLRLQHDYDAYYFIADWHALTSDWADTTMVRSYSEEMVLDWLAAGLDPERCTIYRQSDVPEVAELTLYFEMLTPMGWLERVPSYKEQREQITDKDLGNAGFFLYPVLQAADIAIVLADVVPVGEDQLPHVELTREIVRRFNTTYGEYLREPASLIEREGARVPGTDGRKMSKSYGNAIFLSDTPEESAKKVAGMVTDPARKLKSDPGDPDVCPLQQIHKLVGDPAVVADFDARCRCAGVGCVEHKRVLGDDLNGYLSSFRQRRAQLASQPNLAWDVLEDGARRARAVGSEVVGACRRLVRIDGEG